jgi:hypothetical protein
VIKYHGTPFGGSNQEAAEALIGRHAFVSFAAPQQLQVALDVCQSVAFDNGAFSAWKSGKPITDWTPYFEWVKKYMRHPRFDWCIIPDVVDGDEADNIKLLARFQQYFHENAHIGVPVWHMHESDDALKYLANTYRRIAIGSSEKFSTVGSREWHERMTWAMRLICDENGQPITKIHMLRGLNPAVFTKYPFASADSTNAARNCNIQTAWKGTYAPPSNSWRARVLMARSEAFNSAESFSETQDFDLFGEPYARP